MIKILFILLCSIFCMQHDFEILNKTKNEGLELIVQYRGSYNLIKIDENINRNDSIHNMLYEVKILNNSKQQIEFIVSNCSIARYVVLSMPDIRLWINGCANNSLIPIKLKANQEFSFPLIIQVKNATMYKKIQVGFIIMDSQTTIERFYDELAKRRRNFENVIWSKEIDLKPYGGTTYKIQESNQGI